MNLSTNDTVKRLSPHDGVAELSGDTLLRLQKVLTEMLRDVVGICRDHGIDYTLGGGVCLGAVRHGGFIPWDDDIDFNIPRRDASRLLQVLRETRSEKYWVHDVRSTDNYTLGLIRVRL